MINVIKEQVYLTVAAYTIIWVVLIVYVGLVMRRLGRIEKQVEVVEESVETRAAS